MATESLLRSRCRGAPPPPPAHRVPPQRALPARKTTETEGSRSHREKRLRRGSREATVGPKRREALEKVRGADRKLGQDGGEACQLLMSLTSAWTRAWGQGSRPLNPPACWVCGPSGFLSQDSSQSGIAVSQPWRLEEELGNPGGLGRVSHAAHTLVSLWMGVGLRDQEKDLASFGVKSLERQRSVGEQECPTGHQASLFFLALVLYHFRA